MKIKGENKFDKEGIELDNEISKSK